MEHEIQRSDEWADTSLRELAQRQSGTDEILLLWHPGGDRIALLVHDADTGAGLLVEIAPSEALDAFHHPYVYTTQSKGSRRIIERSTTTVDA